MYVSFLTNVSDVRSHQILFFLPIVINLFIEIKEVKTADKTCMELVNPHRSSVFSCSFPFLAFDLLLRRDEKKKISIIE